jgi:hypothetical protein
VFFSLIGCFKVKKVNHILENFKAGYKLGFTCFCLRFIFANLKNPYDELIIYHLLCLFTLKDDFKDYLYGLYNYCSKFINNAHM